MSAQYSSSQPQRAAGSIVDRASAILEEQAPRVTREPAMLGSGLAELPLALVSDLERRVQHLREQVMDLVAAFVRLGERLPASALAGTNNPLAGVASSLLRFDGTGLPLLRPAEATVGQVARTVLGLVNDLPRPTSVVLRVTNLVNDLGEEIAGNLVNFVPNPLNLPPGGELSVQASVHVPPGTKPGSYSGLVQAAGLEATRAVITVVVMPRAGG